MRASSGRGRARGSNVAVGTPCVLSRGVGSVEASVGSAMGSSVTGKGLVLSNSLASIQIRVHAGIDLVHHV